MTAEGYKTLIHEVLDERTRTAGVKRKASGHTRRKPMQASKALILFATVMYALTWIVAVFSWFSSGTLPDELMKYTTYLYGAALAIYGGKSAYENKAKIECSYDHQPEGYEDQHYP